MRAFEAPCPACGAPVEFKTRTGLVTICPHCQSAVARGDRQVEDIGKVAATGGNRLGRLRRTDRSIR